MNKLYTLLFGAALVAALGAYLFGDGLTPKSSEEPGDGDAEKSLRGYVLSVVADERTATVLRDDGKEIRVALSSEASIRKADGSVGTIADVRPGFVVESRGRYAAEDSLAAVELKLESIPGLSYYMHPDFKVYFAYLQTWKPDPAYGSINGIPTRFSGKEGYFGVDALSVEGSGLDGAIASIAYHKLKPYGDSPEIVKTSVDGREAALIVPREDEVKDAALVVAYPQSTSIGKNSYDFLVLYASKHDIWAFARSMVIFQNSPSESKLAAIPSILLFQPKGGVLLGSFSISGLARVFENSFGVRITSPAKGLLYESPVSVAAPDAGMYGYFEHEVVYTAEIASRLGEEKDAVLEVFEPSAESGEEVHVIRVPFVWQPGTVETEKIKAYFPNSKLDPEISCTRVFAVEREIPKSKAVARAALEELLRGPLSGEKEKGYFSSINEGVKIQKLAIQDGVASVDFNAKLDEAVGGSCRVASIRTQITQTLKQFSTVKSVVMSIDGKIDGILQP